MYTNSDTLTNKMEELEVFVNKHNIDIIAICETLPKNSLDDKNDYWKPLILLPNQSY